MISTEELLEQEETIKRVLRQIMPRTDSFESLTFQEPYIIHNNSLSLYKRDDIFANLSDVSMVEYVLIQICREYGFHNRFTTIKETTCNVQTLKLIYKVYRVVTTTDKHTFVYANLKYFEDAKQLVRNIRLAEIIDSL